MRAIEPWSLPPHDDDERPARRAAGWIAVAFGVLLLGLAAAVVIWVTPTVLESFDCDDAGGAIDIFGSFAVLLGGVGVVLFAFSRTVADRDWPVLAIAFVGVCLVVLAVTGFRLYGQAWGLEGCSD